MSTPQAGRHAAPEQVARLLALVPYLLARGEVRLDDAAAALGVDPDQLDKDLRVLFMCGLPGGYPDDLIDVDLEALEGDRIIRVDNADYLARPVRFSPSEATALVVALRALAQSAAPADAGGRTTARWPSSRPPGRTVAAQRVHVEADARAGQRARARARGRDRPRPPARARLPRASRDEQSTRVVDPRGLGPGRRRAYLDAWCHTARRRPRLPARPDRGRHRARHARSPSRPVGARDLGSGWFDRGGHHGHLRLAPPARWVTEYYPVTDARPGPDGSLDVDLEVASEDWLRQLLFRLAPHAERGRTAGVRRLVHASARAALSLYTRPGVR